MPRRLPVPSILGLAAILLASVLIVPVFAGRVATAQPTGNSEVPEFEYEPNLLSCSEGFTYAVYPADDFGNAIDTEIQVDPETEIVRFRVPELEGGQYFFERSCPESEQQELPDSESRLFQFSRVLLTKSVAGEVPTGTTFTVNVACSVKGDPFLDEDRQFGAEGGQAQVVFYDSVADCTITEPDDGGAESVTIEPETVAYTGEFSDGSSTVTNTFPAPEPEPEPTEPEPSPSPTEDVDDTVDEAEPAEPVETEPDFTG